MFNRYEDENEGRGRHRHRCGPGAGEGPRGRHGHGRGFGGGRERGFGRGGRMFGPGDLKLVLLALIEEQPRHGYELIKAIEDLFAGAYAPSPGAVYPTLSLLEDQGLLASSVDDGGKRVFSLTDAGRAWLAENRVAVDGVMARMRLAARMISGQVAPEAVREAMHTLRQAIMSKPGDWSDAETGRVVELLMAAVRDISK